MNADAYALLGAIESMIKDGHTFQVAPSGGLDWKVQASISGPTGSRSAVGNSAQEALEKLIVDIVEARLLTPPRPVYGPGFNRFEM